MSTAAPGAALRVALIGYGEAGRILHGPLVAAADGLELAAIVTADTDRGRAARQSHPTAAILRDAGDVWRGAFDLVVIATPPGSHATLVERAIDAGMPTVVDKPFALSSAEGGRLVARSRAAGVPLTIFQNRRWDSDFLTLRRVLADRLVGAPTRLVTRFETYRDVARRTWQESAAPGDGGGVLLDFGSHRIDQAIVLFGPPRFVAAEIRRSRPGSAVEDDVFLALGFADDVAAHVHLSRAEHAPGPAFHLLGTDAAFEPAGTDPQWAALDRGERPGGAGWGRPRGTGRLHRDAEPGPGTRRIRPLPGAWDRFYPAVREALRGGGPMPVDPRDAVDVLRVIEAARISAAEGRAVPLEGLGVR